MSTVMTTKQTSVRPITAAFAMGALLALLWFLEIVDSLTGNALDAYGIHARELDGLPEIFSAPLLHYGFDHLISNSLPFFVLGLLVLLGGAVRWVLATLISVVSSGLSAWVLSPTNSVILGASGLIFGWLTYLIVRGFFSGKAKQIVLGIVVLVVYGGMIWGVLPSDASISWQAHLGGAVGGIIAASLIHRREAHADLP